MSDKDQKKKDGRDTSKKRQRMKESVKSRKRRASKQSRDEVDTVKFKPGSAGDRSRRGAP